jgi:hypothetical protein
MKNYESYYDRFGYKKPLGYNNIQESIRILELLLPAIKENQLLYNYLISISPTKKERLLIEYIKENLLEEYNIIIDMYKNLTKINDIELPQDTHTSRPPNFKQGIKKGIFSILNIIEKYRLLFVNIPNRYYKDIIFKFILEQVNDANRLSDILIKKRDSYILEKQEKSQIKRITDDYTPDAWIVYNIDLVKSALNEYMEGGNLQYLFAKYILAGVLVGKGNTPADAINQVEEWKENGESELLNDFEDLDPALKDKFNFLDQDNI